jgi:hypothetical protein
MLRIDLNYRIVKVKQKQTIKRTLSVRKGRQETVSLSKYEYNPIIFSRKWTPETTKKLLTMC